MSNFRDARIDDQGRLFSTMRPRMRGIPTGLLAMQKVVGSTPPSTELPQARGIACSRVQSPVACAVQKVLGYNLLHKLLLTNLFLKQVTNI